MQWMKIKISEQSRSRIGGVLFLLNISIILVCHATGAMGIYMKHEVASLNDFMVFYNTSSLFKLLFCVSLVFAVFHLIGAKICYDCAFYETRERFHSVLFYWVLAVCALVPLSGAAFVVLTVHQHQVLQALQLGFRHVMKQYKVDRAMREYVNRLQIEHQCCGGAGVSDWYKTSWVDASAAVPISRLANSHYMEANGEFLPRWAPFSCCRQDFIGAPCESVWLFFRPRRNRDWLLYSRLYSIDYLKYFKKYSQVYENVTKLAKKPPANLMERGRKIVNIRFAEFDSFLRGVTGHSKLAPPPSRSRPEVPEPSKKLSETTIMRTLLEAFGVPAQSFPVDVLVRRGRQPYPGPVKWTYDNISTVETGSLQHLLRLDGRKELETLELLAWRSFNQMGCAEPISHNARVTMRASAILFACIAAAQVLITILARYMQTSIDTAYRWGNPLMSTPGYLFSTSQPPRPEDNARERREGNRIRKMMRRDLAEDSDITTLMSPSWTSAELEEEEGLTSLSDATTSATSSASAFSSADDTPTTSNGSSEALTSSPDIAAEGAGGEGYIETSPSARSSQKSEKVSNSRKIRNSDSANSQDKASSKASPKSKTTTKKANKRLRSSSKNSEKSSKKKRSSGSKPKQKTTSAKKTHPKKTSKNSEKSSRSSSKNSKKSGKSKQSSASTPKGRAISEKNRDSKMTSKSKSRKSHPKKSSKKSHKKSTKRTTASPGKANPMRSSNKKSGKSKKTKAMKTKKSTKSKAEKKNKKNKNNKKKKKRKKRK